jgi:GAF domain-containing protein
MTNSELRDTLHDTQRGLGEQVELSNLVSAILWHAAQNFGNVGGAVYVFDGKRLSALAERGGLAQKLGARLPVDDPGLVGEAWRSAPPWTEAHPGPPGPGHGPLAATPIATDLQRVGVMVLAQRVGGPAFPEGDLLALREFAGLVAISVANARLYFAARQELLERRRAEDAAGSGSIDGRADLAELGDSRRWQEPRTDEQRALVKLLVKEIVALRKGGMTLAEIKKQLDEKAKGAAPRKVKR